MKNLLYILLFVPFTFLGQNNSYVEQDIPLELQEGWNLFGFTCLESINVINAFSLIEESVIILKDNGGLSYLPEWNFNGIGDLQYSRGYQIKLTQEITDFQFCPAIVPLVDSDVECVYNIEGCMDISACNYNELATDVGICEFPIEGYDCEGNIVPQYQVGDYAEGGIIFYVDETGEYGLVAAMEDLIEGSNMGTYGIPEGFEWGCWGTSISGADGQAIGTGYQNTLDIVAQNCQTENGGITAAQAALDAEINGYSDWYIPSKDELAEMYNTIGNGGFEGNIGGFETIYYPYYWSSSESSSDSTAWYVGFSIGLTLSPSKDGSLRVRVIRAFGSIIGCIDSLACNFSPEANTDDGSCEYPETEYNCDGNLLEACPYDIYVEYGADALNYNANLCQTLIVYGCTDYIAENYDSQANTDDNSCAYILGCMDTSADNYNTEATQEDNSCIYYGCMDATADNYNPQANQTDSTCIYYGCMNVTADNYDAAANTEDNSCIIYGCTLSAFPNYNSQATTDDFSCDMSSMDVFGCTDANYMEYNAVANQSNGTCSIPVVLGCTDATACNHDTLANTDDNLCEYTAEGFDCDGYFLVEIGEAFQGGILFYIDETGEHGLVAALEDITEGSNMGNWGTPEGFEWGCYQQTVSGADGTAIGTGYQNTLDIVAQNCQTENGGITAAQATLNYETEGYTDWYLPSKDELVEMYNTIGNGGPEGNIGGFKTSNYPLYWSSSEGNNNYAWSVAFDDGLAYGGSKSSSLRVRAVRAF